MKLVLKQPKDKSPFIGIQFDSDYIAKKTNADLLYILEKKDCQLILEPYNQHYLNLRLFNKDLLIDREYKQVEYNSTKLRSWFDQNKNSKEFNFSHVIMDYDKHVVVKIHMTKLFLIKLKDVKLMMEE